jgi:hypothetical protein
MVHFNYSWMFRKDTTMEYTTWYEFKKDCENILGYSLLNETWLKVKPMNPLPWNDTDVMSVLLSVDRLRRTTGRSKQEAGVRH